MTQDQINRILDELAKLGRSIGQQGADVRHLSEGMHEIKQHLSKLDEKMGDHDTRLVNLEGEAADNTAHRQNVGEVRDKWQDRAIRVIIYFLGAVTFAVLTQLEILNL